MRPHGLLKLSTDKIPPIVKADMETAVAKQGTPTGKGDVVLIHTGWLSVADEDKKTVLEKEPGLGKEGVIHLASLGVVAVDSDPWAVEAIPFEDPKEAFPVHQIEKMDSRALAADEGYEFLFALGQPNPVAVR